jgi:hypothetical protein
MLRTASAASGSVSNSIGRIRAQETGKTTEARVSRPSDKRRAASTDSATASRVKRSAPPAPGVTVPAG